MVFVLRHVVILVKNFLMISTSVTGILVAAFQIIGFLDFVHCPAFQRSQWAQQSRGIPPFQPRTQTGEVFKTFFFSKIPDNGSNPVLQNILKVLVHVQ
jgi:hypothetical protein